MDTYLFVVALFAIKMSPLHVLFPGATQKMAILCIPEYLKS